MKGPGILWMLQTAAGLSMAGPMFIVGVEFLRSGQYVFGITFLSFGTIALYLPTYFVNQIGGPRTWLRRRFGRDSSGESDTDSDEATVEAETDETSTRVPLLDRLRK